jgi:DNA-binding Xre family transcriptional regulator
MTIGEAIKVRILELCKERRITTNKLSIISGVTQSTISNIVTGRNCSVTVKTLKRLCDGLEINMNDFFADDIFVGLEEETK